MSKAGKRLLGAAQEMRAIARGEVKPAHMHIPADVDVKAIRKNVGLSQDAFASEFCFSVNQIKDWEQNRTRPLGSNRAYLMMIERHPETVRQMLEEMRIERHDDDSERMAVGM
ncbi:helix-turn-helix domain-containing protein [Mesorhizobium neociceri]|uniref:Transcriptional regulator n=1 Tax=Mesorhizobium neociceri TaxID=1307853 RepID=A0A838BFP8_9HYPH|nr:helix-turn-helix domain-containing protein [Mesorhizobium neociceri]MBA1145033.1 transcriptional regulator [Mesorhizobium neociceri]